VGGSLGGGTTREGGRETAETEREKRETG
jgi:hypothetical protein